MPPETDLQAGRRRPWAASALLAAALLAACSTPARPPVPAPEAPPAPMLPATPEPVVAPPPAPLPDPVAAVLDYADRVRNLQGAELTQEISRINEAAGAQDQLRLAVLLIQTRQLYDLVRAQDLLQRVLANPAAAQLHPLARLLATRYAEQRRVEDQLDRQGLQLRDTQRRLDQTNDKLEALREIERSMTIRPGAPAAASSTPRGRTRPATP